MLQGFFVFNKQKDDTKTPLFIKEMSYLYCAKDAIQYFDYQPFEPILMF